LYILLTMNILNFAAQPVAHCASIENVPSVPRMSKNCNPFTSQLRGLSSIRESGIFFPSLLGLGTVESHSVYMQIIIISTSSHFCYNILQIMTILTISIDITGTLYLLISTCQKLVFYRLLPARSCIL
jgi:hypothetical protein